MTVDLALSLRSADTGGWRDPARLAALAPGATLHPVDRRSSRDAEGELFVGLHLPAARPVETAWGRAESFRAVLSDLTEALGDPHVLGAYGSPGPFSAELPEDGSHFARWRGPDSLELRAGPGGPDLWLFPSSPMESWHWRQGHGDDHALGGFFAYRPDEATRGLGLPGGWSTDDWRVFEDAAAAFFRTLPAATWALDFELSFTVNGPDGVLFDVLCGDQLEVACLRDDAPPGWLPGPPVHERWTEMPYTTTAWDPGQVDGEALAELLADTARTLGVDSPRGLGLGDHAQRQNGYRVEYYGLTLREMP
ncbi:hypothetical protein [Actinocorallia longicatena]|uniref:Uncharacterized protein n=1 Tax=Actinocorallia longicatena TaxID=111803 RepID=A0ABP6QNF4_9ACTN